MDLIQKVKDKIELDTDYSVNSRGTYPIIYTNKANNFKYNDKFIAIGLKKDVVNL